MGQPMKQHNVMNIEAIPEELEGWDCPSLDLEYLNQYIKPSLGSKWYDLGAELLEDDDDIALLNEIQCEYASDIDTCCTKMFQLWLQKQRVASWGQLIKCLRQPYVNLHELASKIEQIISESPSSDQPACHYGTLVTTIDLNKDFSSLLATVSAILISSSNKESDLEKFKNYCSSLRISDNSSQPLFSFKDIHKCTNFYELLRILHWHLSWDEHSILTHIVAECQSVKAQEEVENFDKKLAAICEGLVISNTPECDLPPEFKKFSVVINKPYKNLTKSNYEEIKEFIFKQLDTRHYVATQYVKVLFDSLHLEWYVTSQAVPYMISMAYQNKEVFVKEGFVFVQIGEETIFNYQSTLVQPSLDGENHGTKNRKSLLKRGETQASIPDTAINKRLQKILKSRAKSCLQFFKPENEQSESDLENSIHSNNSSRASSPTFENKSSYENDDDEDSTCNDDTKRQSASGSSYETSFLSELEKRHRFSCYVASTQSDDYTMSDLIMEIFDNDDMEGIIPPRFLETEPDAMLDNIRRDKESTGPSTVPSKRSSLDGEVFIPSYNVHLVRQLRKSLRVSTATVTRIPRYSYGSRTFSLDLTESFHRLSAAKSVASEDRCTSPVDNTECNNERSSVSSTSSQRQRRMGKAQLRSRESVLQWLSIRTSSCDSNKSGMWTVPEQKVSTSASEASDLESYHSYSDELVVA